MQNLWRTAWARLVAVLAWFAVLLQFALLMQSQAAPKLELLVRFFSYFTILSNLLVAVLMSACGWFPNVKWRTHSNQIAIAVYISVVGLAYNTVLRFLSEPTGWQKLADEMLHTIVPILYLVYCWNFIRYKFAWRAIIPWMYFPVLYLIYILLRGHFSGFYPYPFLSVPELGYARVAVNCLLVTLVFVGLSLAYIGILRRRSNK